MINWESEYVGGFVGVVQISNVKVDTKDQVYEVKITIKSRFDTNRPFFLAYMLAQADPLFHDWNVPISYDNLFDFLLVTLFVTNLKDVAKQGIFRTYQRFNRNDDRFKGSIDIARHIRLNAGMKNGKLAYYYRENTYDNNLNHLILFAYEHLKVHFPEESRFLISRDNTVKRIITSIRENAPEFITAKKDQVIFKSLRPIAHPYYQRYEKLRRISLIILMNKGVSIFGKEMDQIKGILYYIPDLWETCLENRLKVANTDYYIKSQERIKVLDSIIYPDFVFYKKMDNKNKAILILDAKFKPNWYYAASTGKLTGKNYNFWEDYNKCIRDMDAVNADHSGVIFPTCKEQSGDSLSQSWEYNRSEKNTNKFYCYSVYVPESENINYTIWKKLLVDQLNIMEDNIRKTLELY